MRITHLPLLFVLSRSCFGAVIGSNHSGVHSRTHTAPPHDRAHSSSSPKSRHIGTEDTQHGTQQLPPLLSQMPVSKPVTRGVNLPNVNKLFGCNTAGICGYAGSIRRIEDDVSLLFRTIVVAAFAACVFGAIGRYYRVVAGGALTLTVSFAAIVLSPYTLACARYDQVAYKSRCPDGSWLDAVAPILVRRNMVQINVGANTGFAISGFLRRFRRDAVSNRKWHQYLLEMAPTVTGGVCKEALLSQSRTSVQLADGADANLQVIAVELLGSNVKLLRHVLARSGTHGVVIHAAGGNVLGLAHEPPTTEVMGPSGAEGFSASLDGNGSTVPMVTVDELARRHNVTSSGIDLLSIDCEGWDPLVLEGTASLLQKRLVRLLEFEYHEKGHWAKTPGLLRMTIDWLSSFGYACFWQGTNGDLAPLTTKCPLAFLPMWSNVICAHEPAILAKLHALTPYYGTLYGQLLS